MKKNSPNLAREISFLTTSIADARVEFHNGSWLKIAASNDGARGKRSNLLIIDEFRMVDLNVITRVLRKFKSNPRQPKYLDKPEYAHLKERNKEIYMSSAWYKHHWSWNRLDAYISAMTDGKQYFACGLPYQLSIAENLLMKEEVLDEMSEEDFDAIAWEMEMGCMFFGESDNSYFNFEDLNRSRKLLKPIYPKPFYEILKDPSFKYIPKQEGEIRLLCCDIATAVGSKNDASAYVLICLNPNKTYYTRNIRYMESVVGGHTVLQAIRIRQLYDDLDCDYVVLDTQNVGMGIFDNLCMNLSDKERGVEYQAWTCINDEKMAERCLVSNAKPVIYSIKANAQFNSDCAVALKDDFKRDKVKMLVGENEAIGFVQKLKGYDKLSQEDKAKLEMPYRQITALVNEMVNLDRDMSSLDLIRLKEPKSHRKDRYSATTYGNYISRELEKKLYIEDDFDDDDVLVYY